MKHVLIVEDVLDIADPLSEMLRDKGYACTVCNCGQEGEKELQEHSYDLLITDIIMPNGNGLDLILFARQHRFPGAIIAISGGGPTMSPEIALGASSFHADYLLKKPFTNNEIDEALEAVKTSPRQRLYAGEYAER